MYAANVDQAAPSTAGASAARAARRPEDFDPVAFRHWAQYIRAGHSQARWRLVARGWFTQLDGEALKASGS